MSQAETGFTSMISVRKKTYSVYKVSQLFFIQFVAFVMIGFSGCNSPSENNDVTVESNGDTENTPSGNIARKSIPEINYKTLDNQVSELLRGIVATLEKDKDDPIVWTQLGYACDAHELYDCAESCYQTAYDIGLRDWNLVYNFACVLNEQGKKEASLTMFSQFKEGQEDYYPAFYKTGEVYQNLGQHEKARIQFEGFLKLIPNSGIGLRALSKSLIELGEYEKAQQHLNTVYTAIRNDRKTVELFIELYSRTGNIEKEREFAAYVQTLPEKDFLGYIDPLRKKVMLLRRDNVTLFARIRENTKKKSYNLVIDDLDILINANPENIPFALRKADVYQQSGQYKKAIIFLESLVASHPDNSEIQYKLGLAFEADGQPDRAKQSFQKAVDIDGNKNAAAKLGK